MVPHIDIGPLELQTFGLCLAFAFLADGAIGIRRLKETGRPPDWAYEALLAAVVGGLVGSRVDYLIQNPDRLAADFLGSVFSGTGLVFFGGLIGGAVAVVAWGLFRRYPLLELADLGAPALALGYALGRIGCQLSGDGDYGTASDLPWAMAYPEGTDPTTVPSHPTPIYETIVMGLAALGLWRLRGRLRPGLLLALYLLVAGVERFLIEFIRLNPVAVAGLTVPQLFSVAMVTAGAGWLAYAARRGGLARGAVPTPS